jgi:hypothetical protein
MKRLAALISFSLCALIFIIFTVTAAVSKRNVPMFLEDISGDTSGIRALTVTGRVFSREFAYMYDFEISPHKTSVDWSIFREAGKMPRLSNYVQSWQPRFIPVGEVRTEVVDSDKSFKQNNAGIWVPMTEVRQYADSFEVVVMTDLQIPIWAEEMTEKLYFIPDFNSYIFKIMYNGEEVDITEAMHEPYGYMGFEMTKTDFLASQLRINDSFFIVPTGKGLFGHTAVYKFDMHNNGFINTEQDDVRGHVVPAEVLYPIVIERGSQTEICGLIEFYGDVILVMRHAGAFELIRINIETGTSVSARAEGNPYIQAGWQFHSDFWQMPSYYISEDSIIFARLINNEFWNDYVPEIHFWAFDLSGGGLTLAAHVRPAVSDLWGDIEGFNFDVLEAILKDGVLYVVMMEIRQMLRTYLFVDVVITALALDGTVIGRSKLLTGFEQDHRLTTPEMMHSNQIHARNITLLKLR